MFLTAQELHDLTGYVRHSDQRRWLTSHGWIFEISRSGSPRVLRSYAENKMSGVADKHAPVLRVAHIRG